MRIGAAAWRHHQRDLGVLFIVCIPNSLSCGFLHTQINFMYCNRNKCFQLTWSVIPDTFNLPFEVRVAQVGPKSFGYLGDECLRV